VAADFVLILLAGWFALAASLATVVGRGIGLRDQRAAPAASLQSTQ